MTHDAHPLPRRLVRTPIAAEITCRSESTLEKLRVRGDGPPFVKIGRTVAYDVADLEAWIAAQPRYQSTSEVRSAR